MASPSSTMSAPPRLALEPQGSWLQLRRHTVEQLQHPVASLIIIDTKLVRFGPHARNAALQIGVLFEGFGLDHFQIGLGVAEHGVIHFQAIRISTARGAWITNVSFHAAENH